MSTTHTKRVRARRVALTRRGAEASADNTWAAAQLSRTERLRANIRRLTAEHDLTLADLARRIGRTNANAFYNLMNGWSSDLSHATLTKLCDAFGITLDVLTGRQPAGPQPGGAARQASGATNITGSTAPPSHAAAGNPPDVHEASAALDASQRALQTARDALAAAEQGLRTAAAALSAPLPPAG